VKGVEASINLEGLGLSSAGSKQICILFVNPSLFIHGTREEMAEFARQITEKAEAA
jgi:hypothetical protein